MRTLVVVIIIVVCVVWKGWERSGLLCALGICCCVYKWWDKSERARQWQWQRHQQQQHTTTTLLLLCYYYYYYYYDYRYQDRQPPSIKLAYIRRDQSRRREKWTRLPEILVSRDILESKRERNERGGLAATFCWTLLLPQQPTKNLK